jgi:hypothetical protein
MRLLPLIFACVGFLRSTNGAYYEYVSNEDIDLYYDPVQSIIELDALRLRLSPSPIVLDVDQATMVLRELEAMINIHYRSLNKEGVMNGCFRGMLFDDPAEITFESGNGDPNRRRSLTKNLRSLKDEDSSSTGDGIPTTILDSRIKVSFMGDVDAPSQGDIMAILQEYINQLNFRGPKNFGQSGMTDPKTRVEASQLPFPVESFTLTWASQGYTLAPTIEEPNPSQPPTNTATDRKGSFNYPVLAGGLVVVVLAGLFLAKRRHRNAGVQLQEDDSPPSPNRKRRWGSHRKEFDGGDEFDGCEWLNRSPCPQSEMGAFPSFQSAERAKVNINFVDYVNQPADPKEIGEIAVNDAASEVSSLGKSEGRMEVTYPASAIMETFPVTNLTRVHVQGKGGGGQLYHETFEGFDRLDDEWVSNKGSGRDLSRLLVASSDSLRYSSDSSQDVDGFFVASGATSLGRRASDADDDPDYLRTPVEFVNPSRIVGRNKKTPPTLSASSNEGSGNEYLQVYSYGDDSSSVGDILRSIV